MGTGSKKGADGSAVTAATREGILKELYGCNYAERFRDAGISEQTRAALYFKGKVQEVCCNLFSIYRLLYGCPTMEREDELAAMCRDLEDFADICLIDSMNHETSDKDFKDI